MQNLLAILSYPHIDPVIMHLGPVALRWYGVAYVVGFLLGYLWLRRMARQGQLHLSTDQLGSLLSWLVLGVLAGGRLGWWLFYHRTEGRVEPWYEPVAVWHGGMSFHGALLGVTLVFLIWSWRRRADAWNIADCAALVAPVGLFFGRIANFINGELVGRVTSVPWAMVFPGGTQPRHPSQLYEAILEGPLLLGALWAARRLRPGSGQVASLFLVAYGLLRFGVEFTRQPDEQLGFIGFGWLTMGQVLSAALVLAGLVLLLVRQQHSSIPAFQAHAGTKNVTEKDLMPFVTTVDSGVAEVVRKQEEGWSYIKGGS